LRENGSDIELSGTLAEIRFHKGNFVIGHLEDGISVKGNMLMPQVGLEYRLRGRWNHSPRWGKTFVFSSYKRSYPRSVSAVRRYLEENAKWIGPETSQKIASLYGEQTLEILKREPERVASEVSGITLPRAQEISGMLKQMEAHEELEIALQDLVGEALSPRLRHKVLELWGPDAPAKIRENPYALIDAVSGVGFLTADRIAQRAGFKLDGYPRIKAGVLHTLSEAAWNSGHTLLPRNLLVLKAREILRIDPEHIEALLLQISSEKVITFHGDAVCLPELRRDEEIIAERLKSLKGNHEPVF
jgi:exodeoxyribonuclease V alpha subunit